MEARQTAARWARILAERATLPICLLYLELVFKASTTGQWWPALVPLTLFSLAAGALLQLVCSFPRQQRTRRIATLAILALASLAFGIEYFVYRKFKVLYDPVTVLAGAGDAAGQFSGSALGMVFSPSGLVYVALFLLPPVAYALCWWRGLLPEDTWGKRDRAALATSAAACHVLALVITLCVPSLASVYAQHYSFQEGAPRFGLLTALRKDAQDLLAGGDELRFDESTAVDASDAGSGKRSAAADAKAAKDEPTKPVIQPAVLDIDFEKLAQDTDNQTWAGLDRYVAGLTPSQTNEYTGLFEGYNLIFISAEAFTAEAIRPDTTPTLWKMWNEGIQLTDYYQFDTAGTTGGECANLFGLLATEGGSSVKMTADHHNALTMGSLLDAQGYEGWAFHNNTYTFYGRDATHNNLGYSHGYMGYGNGMEEWVEWQWPQSDLEMVAGTFDHLYGKLGHKKHPFNVYYMSVSGHSDYGPGENMMAQKNADVVADLPYSDRVCNYLAANVELDRAMKYLLRRLRERKMYRRTVIVIAADHFPYGLDDDAAIGNLPYLSELYGYEVNDVFQRDHNRPIIWCSSMPKHDIHIRVDSPTESVDLLPTLCNLFGVPWDSRLLPGRDVLDPNTEGIAWNLSYDWRTELGTYWAGSGTFEPVEGAEVPEGYVEAHNALVANKISYCRGVLTSDYYRHVFGD